MIQLNPYWKKAKLTKKDKENYKKLTGLNAKELIVPTDKYYDLLYKLYGIEKSS